jgi:hypothetical protein
MGILQKVFDKTTGAIDRLEDSKQRDMVAQIDKGFLRSTFTLSCLKFVGKSMAQLPLIAVAMPTELIAKVVRRPLDKGYKF